MVVGNVEGLEPVDRLLPELVGAPRKDVDVVTGHLQSLQGPYHRPIRQIALALSEECPPSLSRGHLGMALGVELVAAALDQRDRAVEVCDYDHRCFHCLHSSSTRLTHSSGTL